MMTFDEHEPHESTRLYISRVVPRFAGFCTPHDRTGPWGPRVYFTEPIPFEPAIWAARQIVLEATQAQDPYDPRDHVDRAFQLPTAALGDGATYLRGKIAFLTFASIAIDAIVTGYDIIVTPSDGPEWTHFVTKRFPSGESNGLEAIGDRVILTTNDIEDVRFFLAGHGWYLHTVSFLTVVQRRVDGAAVIFCNWDHDRFYFLDTAGALDARIADIGREHGLEVLGDYEGAYVMSSAIPYYTWLQEWIANGAVGVPRGEGSV